MRHKSNQIVIILIVVLLLTGLGVGLYFLIEHIRKQPGKDDTPVKSKTVGADDKCDNVCSSDPTFTGKTIVHQVNCQNPDGTKCDEKNCPKKPRTPRAISKIQCSFRGGIQ